MAHSQAQVGDGAGAVLLHQDVLGLQIPVSDAGLSCANASVFRTAKRGYSIKPPLLLESEHTSDE